MTAVEDFKLKDGNYTSIWNKLLRKLISYSLDSNEWSILMLVISVTYMIWDKEIKSGRPWGILTWKDILKKTQLANSSAAYSIAKLKIRNILQTKPSGKHTQYKINSKVSTWLDIKTLNKDRLLQPIGVKKGDSLLQPIGVSYSNPLEKPLQPIGVVPIKESIKESSLKKPPKPPQKIPENIKVEYPWLDQGAWDDFVKHRIEKKSPLTPLAETRALNFLNEHQEDQRGIIDQTIISNWQGLFPLKGRFKVRATKQDQHNKLKQRGLEWLKKKEHETRTKGTQDS